ncbi:hypothetical protein AVEN_181261-1 [Araneus ventricosus]|uniref:Uncharacterized protein n=1 Tax=Araneus ventricosus TaxID=182803 RepID=A0A4Y2MPR1_ARAVE|nr:hypothetical protein AVEN_181261-1 [Araneus ventricosus]
MKLKDCIPQIDDDYNLDIWDPKEIIEVLWDNGKPYPANILQFGENKKLMDRLIDDLIIGIVNANQVPLIQDLSKREKRNEKSSLKLVLGMFGHVLVTPPVMHAHPPLLLPNCVVVNENCMYEERGSSCPRV